MWGALQAGGPEAHDTVAGYVRDSGVWLYSEGGQEKRAQEGSPGHSFNRAL